MKNYEKPMILANEELAEGVYAASGSSGSGDGALIVEATITSNDGSSTCYFSGTVQNTSANDVSSWSATLVFDGPVSTATVWNCNTAISGSTIIITPQEGSWNETIAAGGKVDFGGQVTGAKVLSLVS